MRRYIPDEEERIRAQVLVREWARSGLLEATQAAPLAAELRVDVRRTNNYLRAVLALFTVLIVAASVIFVGVEWKLDGRLPAAALTGTAALVCIGLAELLVGRFRCYRFGVEEALAASAVVLLSFSAATFAGQPPYGRFEEASRIVGLLTGAAGGLWLHRRFGYVYAAIGGMACAALLPLQIAQLESSEMSRRLLAAAPLAVAFVIARAKRLRYRDDYPGDEYAALQAAAWAGLYLVVNLHVSFGLGFWSSLKGGPFYWLTYVMIWLLPLAGLRWGIRDKDRELMDVSIVLMLITLVTNKPYLGWPRNSWDPILLGLFLMVVAVTLRRWLSAGPNGARGGFTSTRVLQKDSAMLTLVSTAAAAFQPNTPAAHRDPAAPGFAGGRSGGAGGGASY